MQTRYTAVVTVRGGREGHAKSSDGMLDVDLMSPHDTSRPGDRGTNPEQLFAAGYAACFESALRLAARQQGKKLKDGNITAHVSLNQDDDKRYWLGVELHGRFDGATTEEVRELMAQAHEICPYSRATRGNVEVQLFAE